MVNYDLPILDWFYFYNIYRAWWQYRFFFFTFFCVLANSQLIAFNCQVRPGEKSLGVKIAKHAGQNEAKMETGIGAIWFNPIAPMQIVSVAIVTPREKKYLIWGTITSNWGTIRNDTQRSKTIEDVSPNFSDLFFCGD